MPDNRSDPRHRSGRTVLVGSGRGRGQPASVAHQPPRQPGPPSPAITWDEVRPWLAPPPRASAMAGWALLPLRLFLGVTFCFAGLQKLANPNFFHASSPISIQAQMAAAARRSPIHALMGPLTHVAVLLGLVIAFGELAVGIGTLLGLWARAAAVGGALISFMLFLTVSFHSSPYYVGSDIVFVFAWLPFVVTGSGGVLSADAVVGQLVRRRTGAGPAALVPVPFDTVRQVCGAYEEGLCRARRGAPCEPSPCPWLLPPRQSASRLAGERELDRRTFAAQGVVAAAAAAAALAAGGVAAAGGRLAGKAARPSGVSSLGLGGTGAATSTTAAPTTTAAGGATPSTAPPTTPTTTSPPATPAGTKIGPASAVPVGGAAQFTDPASGDPSLVVQPKSGTFLAFDAVCPHAGCVVGYDSGNRSFVCPCHGSQFNGRTGAVETGPATTGLSPLKIAEGPDGQLYVT